jgi:hypothetical protein
LVPKIEGWRKVGMVYQWVSQIFSSPVFFAVVLKPHSCKTVKCYSLRKSLQFETAKQVGFP